MFLLFSSYSGSPEHWLRSGSANMAPLSITLVELNKAYLTIEGIVGLLEMKSFV
jgi:hypothetical protein